MIPEIEFIRVLLKIPNISLPAHEVRLIGIKAEVGEGGEVLGGNKLLMSVSRPGELKRRG
jgi:hypothetical protein